MKIDKSYSNTININDNTTNILQAKIDILSALVQGQNDIIQGRILSLEKSFDSIDFQKIYRNKNNVTAIVRIPRIPARMRITYFVSLFFMFCKPPLQQLPCQCHYNKYHKQHKICHIKHRQMYTSVFNASHLKSCQRRKRLPASQQLRENCRITDHHHYCHRLPKRTSECHHRTCYNSRPDCRKYHFDQHIFSW